MGLLNVFDSNRGAVSSGRSTVVSVLDVGSSKFTCVIAKLTPRPAGEAIPGRTHDVRVLGFGHQRARGVKSGVIIDLDAGSVVRKAATARSSSSVKTSANRASASTPGF